MSLFVWCVTGSNSKLIQSADIDECTETRTTPICPRGSRCINTNGSHTCICNEGYFHLQNLTGSLNKCEGKLIANFNIILYINILTIKGIIMGRAQE